LPASLASFVAVDKRHTEFDKSTDRFGPNLKTILIGVARKTVALLSTSEKSMLGANVVSPMLESVIAREVLVR
jgi:hypothetical protein